jgi:hypothetical protein
MEPEGSLPYSQVPATCPYPEPTREIEVYCYELSFGKCYRLKSIMTREY